MKIFLCSEVVRELDFAAQCRFVRATGYDGLEIAPFTLADDPAALGAAEIKRFRAVADAEGVEIAGLHWLLAVPEGLSITTDDDQVARRTIAFGRKLVDLCHGLGGRYLVHGSPLQRRIEPGGEAEARARGLAYFAAMAEEAEKAGLTYIIEPLSRADTGYVVSVDEALEIIAEIGSPALATMVDCYAGSGNGEDIPALLEKWVPQGVIRHVHFNDDNKRGPGEGGINFRAIVDMLARLDYAGTAAVEPFVYEPDGRSCAARAIGYLRGLEQGRRRETGT